MGISNSGGGITALDHPILEFIRPWETPSLSASLSVRRFCIRAAAFALAPLPPPRVATPTELEQFGPEFGVFKSLKNFEHKHNK